MLAFEKVILSNPVKLKPCLYFGVIVAGLATEFMTKAEAKKYYGKNGPSSYKDIVPDMHRARYVTSSPPVSNIFVQMAARRLD